MTGRKRPLVSGRHHLNLLRTQLGRLPSLTEIEAQTVMLACVAAERAESVIELARKALAPADVVVHRRDEKRALAESAFKAACAALEAAETLLAATDPTRSKGVGGKEFSLAEHDDHARTEDSATFT